MQINVTPKPGANTKGLLTMESLVFPCALGRSGLTSQKREGDGATPRGEFRLLEVFFRRDRGSRPVTALPVSEIRPYHGWCDASWDANYNRLISLPYQASHEELMRKDNLYDIIVVLDYNIRERKQQAGSAIFFHLARPGYTPTEGCVAVDRRAMLRILNLIGPEGATMQIG